LRMSSSSKKAKPKVVICVNSVVGYRSTIFSLAKLMHDSCSTSSSSKPRGSIVIHFITKEDYIIRKYEQGLRKCDVISTIPQFRDLCKKAEWAELMEKYYEGNRTSWPKTFIVPDEKIPKAIFKKSYHIYKPSIGAQGDGIYLIKSKAELDRRLKFTNPSGESKCGILQRYVSQPLLLDGFKFDFRLYIVYFLHTDEKTGEQVHKSFLFNDGLVRVCTSKYQKPSSKNVYKLNSHLTNYSLNKFCQEFSHSDDASDGKHGSKRTAEATIKYISSLRNDSSEEKQDIETKIWEAFLNLSKSVVQVLRKGLEEESSLYERDYIISNAFNILGIDVLLTESLEPVLLEVNASPSLRTDTVFPMEGKFPRAPTIEEFLEQNINPNDEICTESVLSEAIHYIPKKGMRCLCRDHHRPHEHRPCKIDLHVKLKLLKATVNALKVKNAMKTTDRNDIIKMCGESLYPLT